MVHSINGVRDHKSNQVSSVLKIALIFEWIDHGEGINCYAGFVNYPYCLIMFVYRLELSIPFVD